MAQEQNKSSIILIIIAIIGVCGTVVAATINVMGNINVEKIRQEAELTKIALSTQPTEAILQNTANASTQTIYPTLIVAPTTLAIVTTPTIGLDSTNYNKLTFAILVGVTSQTNFNLTAASNYSYVANVKDVDTAILELSKVYSIEDIIYVVHVPELRVTPGNPGSCKLFLTDVERLKQYPLGWIIGGKNIVPSQYESNLQFCFNQ